jgi:hypothetical protein
MQHHDMSAARPRVLYEDGINIVGMFQDVQISISSGEPSPEFLRSAARFAKDEAAKLPHGMGLMIVINAETRAPSDEAREYMKKMYPQLSGHVSALVRVVEGEGFVAAAKRSVITLIDLTLRLKCPTKVVGTVEEGTAWLLKQLESERSRKYDPADLVRAVRELRRRRDDMQRAGA